MRRIWNVLKWAAVAVMVLCIVIIAINWNDQSPSPAALEMRSILHESAGIPVEENAYVYLLGFDAPQGKDPIKFGSECIVKLDKLLQSENPEQALQYNCEGQDPAIQDSDSKPSSLDVCLTPDQICEQTMKEEKKKLVKWMEEKDWLLHRYLRLLMFRKWHTNLLYSPYTPLPSYGSVGEGQKMLLIKAWLLAGEGKYDEVKRLLTSDVQFWRSALASSDSLIQKMIASAYLARHFTFSNLIFRRFQTNDISPPIPEEWLSPLKEDELSMKKTFAGEWEFSTSIINYSINYDEGLVDADESEEGPSLTDRLLNKLSIYLLLPQATENRMAESMLKLSDILNVQIEQLPSALEQADKYTSDMGSENYFLYPYNPIGNVLVNISLPIYSSYAPRVYNLEGVRRAGVLTTMLRAKGIGATQVDSALSKADLRNPYDGNPFIWEESTKSIVFKGMGSDDRNTYKFLY